MLHQASHAYFFLVAYVTNTRPYNRAPASFIFHLVSVIIHCSIKIFYAIYGGKMTKNATARHKVQRNKATENVSIKHKVLGHKATENASAKPEGAKRPRSPAVSWAKRHVRLVTYNTYKTNSNKFLSLLLIFSVWIIRKKSVDSFNIKCYMETLIS